MDKKSYLEQVESGIVGNEQTIEDSQEDLQRHYRLQKLLDAQRKATQLEWDAKKKGIKMISPQYEFQNDEQYMEAQLIMLDVNMEQKLMELEDQAKQLVKVIKAKEEAVEALKEGEKDE